MVPCVQLWMFLKLANHDYFRHSQDRCCWVDSTMDACNWSIPFYENVLQRTDTAKPNSSPVALQRPIVKYEQQIAAKSLTYQIM